MRPSSVATPRLAARRSLAAACAVVLVADVGLLYLRQPAHVFTFSDAVQRYRTTGAAPARSDDAPPAAVTASAGAAAAPGAPAGTTNAEAPAPRRSLAAPAASAHATTASGPTGPRAGVYTYATQGYGETDAFGGARQDYPATSTVTAQPAPCGWTERWQPLQERWDNWLVCAGAAGAFGSHLATYVEFLHHSQRDDYDCEPSNLFLPAQPQPGQSWNLRCGGPSGTVVGTGSVVGFDTVAVGGSAVRTAHVALALTFGGNNRGTGQQDRWMDPVSGLLVKAVSDLDLQADSVFGQVHYQEHYRLELDSLTPRT